LIKVDRTRICRTKNSVDYLSAVKTFQNNFSHEKPQDDKVNTLNFCHTGVTLVAVNQES